MDGRRASEPLHLIRVRTAAGDVWEAAVQESRDLLASGMRKLRAAWVKFEAQHAQLDATLSVLKTATLSPEARVEAMVSIGAATHEVAQAAHRMAADAIVWVDTIEGGLYHD